MTISPLARAAQNLRVEEVEHLLEKKADANHTDKDGDNALMQAITGIAFCSMISDEKESVEKCCKIALSLIKAKIDIDHKNKKGQSALDMAIQSVAGYPIVQLLVEHGASVGNEIVEKSQALDAPWMNDAISDLWGEVGIKLNMNAHPKKPSATTALLLKARTDRLMEVLTTKVTD